MAQYPQKQIGQYKGPGWNVAPPSAGGYAGSAAGPLSERAKSFEAFSQSLASAGAAYQKEAVDEDLAEGQRRVVEMGEAKFRKLEQAGLLDWTPAMMRGAQTMSGKLAGNAFILSYHKEMAELSDEDKANPEKPLEVYNRLLSEHHAADTNPNTYFDDGFNALAVNPESTGRSEVTNYTRQFASNAKTHALTQFGELTAVTTLNSLSSLKGMDPADEKYTETRAAVKEQLKNEYSVLANGTGEPTASGNIDNGAYGDGFWTADNGRGALLFIESALQTAIESGYDPRIVMEVLEDMTVGKHKLADIREVKIALSAAKAEDGLLGKAVDQWQGNIMSLRTQKIEDFNVSFHELKLAAGNGDTERFDKIAEQLNADIPKLFLGNEMYEQLASVKKSRLDLLDNIEDAERVAREKVQEDLAAQELKKSQAVRLNQRPDPTTGKAGGPFYVRWSQLAMSADPEAIPDNMKEDAFFRELKDQVGSDWTVAELKEKYALFAKEELRTMTEQLQSGEAQVPVPVMKAGALGFPMQALGGRSQQVTYLANVMVNHAINNNKMMPVLEEHYRNLMEGLRRDGVDIDDYLASENGLALTALTMAGVSLQDRGFITNIARADGGLGNFLQHLTAKSRHKPSRQMIEEALKDYIQEKGAPSQPLTDLTFELQYADSFGSIKKRAGHIGEYDDAGEVYAAIEDVNPQYNGTSRPDYLDAFFGGIINDEATRIFKDYGNLEQAFDAAIEHLAPHFMVTRTDNKNGFAAVSSDNHPWIAEHFTTANGQVDYDLLNEYIDFKRNVLFFATMNELEDEELSVSQIMELDPRFKEMSPEDAMDIIYQERYIEGSEEGMASEEMQFQRMFHTQFDGAVILRGDANGNIWYGGGDDVNVPNTGYLSNADMEMSIPHFFEYKKAQDLAAEIDDFRREGLTVPEYRELDSDRKRLSERDARFNVKRMVPLSSEGDALSYRIKKWHWPQMTHGELPDMFSDDIEDMKMWEAVETNEGQPEDRSPRPIIYRREDGSWFFTFGEHDDIRSDDPLPPEAFLRRHNLLGAQIFKGEEFTRPGGAYEGVTFHKGADRTFIKTYIDLASTFPDYAPDPTGVPAAPAVPKDPKDLLSFITPIFSGTKVGPWVESKLDRERRVREGKRTRRKKAWLKGVAETEPAFVEEQRKERHRRWAEEGKAISPHDGMPYDPKTHWIDPVTGDIVPKPKKGRRK